MSGSPGGANGGPLPDVMSAAVYQSPGVVTVEERPVPRPEPDQVVVRVHSCGICGSDIHQLRDGHCAHEDAHEFRLPPGSSVLKD